MKRSIQLVALLLTVFMGSCTGAGQTHYIFYYILLCYFFAILLIINTLSFVYIDCFSYLYKIY